MADLHVSGLPKESLGLVRYSILLRHDVLEEKLIVNAVSDRLWPILSLGIFSISAEFLEGVGKYFALQMPLAFGGNRQNLLARLHILTA